MSTYRCKVQGLPGHVRQALVDTLGIYRDAVAFLTPAADAEWDALSAMEDKNERRNAFEKLVHATDHNPQPKYAEFDDCFPKLPSYLRRAALAEAFGMVSSFRSNYASWEAGGRRGNPPKLPKAAYIFPVFYKDGMFKWDGSSRSCEVKAFIKGDWNWVTLTLRRSDVAYIARRCADRKRNNPMLLKRGKQLYLAFSFEKNVALTPNARRVCAVDLGVSKHATCCVMDYDGTVVARRFIRFAKEEDRLNHALGRVARARRQGARDLRRLWTYARNVNGAISRKTARAIVDFAAEHGCDCVVFEHLDMQGKVRGKRKQRLAVWRKREVQVVAASQAHLQGMRVSRVCAANTSKLAFDGSGPVVRGHGRVTDPTLRKSLGAHSLSKRKCRAVCKAYPYATCRFANGKTYDCDLNASYNIAARYFIRETLREMPERARLAVQAKVPELSRRTTCTLSSLISLRAELAA